MARFYAKSPVSHNLSGCKLKGSRLQEFFKPANACVADEDIQPAPFRDGLLNELLPGLRLRDVTCNSDQALPVPVHECSRFRMERLNEALFAGGSEVIYSNASSMMDVRQGYCL